METKWWQKSVVYQIYPRSFVIAIMMVLVISMVFALNWIIWKN